MFDDHDEEVMGIPSFELLIADGRPVVSGCYFMHPPLRAVRAEWGDEAGKLLVTANDGTEWVAVDVPLTGRVNVVLSPLEEVGAPASVGKADLR